MADHGSTINQLPRIGSVGNSDLIIVSHQHVGTSNTYAISVANLFSNSLISMTCANLVLLQSSSPANSITLTIKKGTIFFDDNYLYIANQDNHVKRVSLSDF